METSYRDQCKLLPWNLRSTPQSRSPKHPPSTPTCLRSQAVEKFTIEKDMAAYIKKDFDSKYGPTWHCIVGRNFGKFCT